MRRFVATTLCVLLLFHSVAWAGLGKKKTMYVGGTATHIPEETEGISSTKDENVFVFEYSGGRFEIPYSQVDSLEYGQKAGRRVGATVALGVTTLGLGALPILFSKKRKHYLTIGYKAEDDKQQVVVLELGKEVTRVTLATLEARTGHKVDYQDDEARKSGRGN